MQAITDNAFNAGLRALNEGKGYIFQGVPEYQHLSNGTRGQAGVDLTDALQAIFAAANGGEEGVMCPGCALITLFNASVEQARRAGQPLDQMARAMRDQYQRLLDAEVSDPRLALTEEIVFN